MSDLGNKKIFSQNLQRIMSERDIKRTQICSDLGFVYSTFSDWYNGKKYPRIDKIEMMANYFGIMKSDLIEDKSADRKPSLPSNVTPYNTQKLPLLGTIACGAPILAEENISRYIDVVDTIKADFCLECRGESMIGAGINDGDIVCIQQDAEVLSGQIAAVRIGDEATLKRVYFHPDHIVLQAENPAYGPKIYTAQEMETEDVQIIGKAVAHLRLI